MGDVVRFHVTYWDFSALSTLSSNHLPSNGVCRGAGASYLQHIHIAWNNGHGVEVWRTTDDGATFERISSKFSAVFSFPRQAPVLPSGAAWFAPDSSLRDGPARVLASKQAWLRSLCVVF